MRWEVHWEHAAVEQLIELAGRDIRLVQRLVLTVTSFGRGERVDRKKLAGGPRRWRLRHGDWRILMTLDGPEAYIDSIDNRRDAY